jgi:DNA-binding helix-hairpin-helix protein with protein kinase domain
MTTPTIHIGGKPAALGKRIGKGGEGEVYLLASDPTKALKIYFRPDQQRLDKVAAIVRAGLAARTKLVSFPIDLATDSRGHFVGFTMNVVGSSKPLHELYSPKARKHNFPQADYRFLVHTACNLASAVAAVHDSGCIIGDINHSGFLISERALVAIIDADSFQVNRDGKSHLCRVGVPEYTPPELQGQSLDGIVRTANHDAFGLAVAIFQLLFLGKHPFAGKYSGTEEMPLEKAIFGGRYAYSTHRNTGMAPPPHGPRPSMMPPAVALAFEQAFTRDPGLRRPTAIEWKSHLNAIEASLVQCGAHKEHYFPRHAGSCPWCAMDNQFGTVVFPPTYSAPSPAALTNFDLDRIWAEIESIRLPDPKTIVPQLPASQPKPSAAAKDAVNARRMNQGLGIVAIGAGAFLLFYMPAIFYISIALAIFGFNRFNASPEAVDKVRQSVELSRASLDSELKTFHQRAGSLEPARLKSELTTARRDYVELPKMQTRWHQEYQNNRRQVQLSEFLDRFRVDKEKITSINRGLAQTLVAYGYETAEDVDYDVTRVPGIGEVRRQRLLDWKAGLEQRFVFNPNPTPSDQVERQKIDLKVSQIRSDLQKRLNTGADQLRDAIRRIESTTKNPHSSLIEAHRLYQASVADAQHVGISVNGVNLSPPDTPVVTARYSSYSANAVSPANLQRQTRPTATATSIQPACPKCGTVMRRRVASRGRYAGKAFWGCPRYPTCDGIRNIP